MNKIAATYNTVAKDYADAFAYEHEKKPVDIEILRRFALLMKDKNSVWDMGCGPGHTAEYLKNLGVDISGLDLSEEMVKLARMNHPGIDFRQGNMLESGFENDSAAGVIAFYAIVHFTEDQVKQAFSEIFRVLKPGGIFLLTFHIGEETIHIDEFLGKKIDADFMFFRIDFIKYSLEGCGFEIMEIIEREPYPDVEYQSRRGYVFAVKY